jgi:hypothetical protein
VFPSIFIFNFHSLLFPRQFPTPILLPVFPVSLVSTFGTFGGLCRQPSPLLSALPHAQLVMANMEGAHKHAFSALPFGEGN